MGKIETKLSVLKKNYWLVYSQETEKTYFMNVDGGFFVQGKSSYIICQWLTNKIEQKHSLESLLNSAPQHVREWIKQLLLKLQNHRLIYLIPAEVLNFLTNFNLIPRAESNQFNSWSKKKL